ncbi:hypothetical protein FA95DRAFT_1610538 [Auriscalpium vulgare]|uniref:Uncharacterized protein n=1 Tax=Auriscalpium vulgare TaxID=40419 RepID=A0ACB8REL9_9AGAM|nr:hypothetical protein FA95DRAFT_1610538 [Auriscalpium vulgare]
MSQSSKVNFSAYLEMNDEAAAAFLTLMDCDLLGRDITPGSKWAVNLTRYSAEPAYPSPETTPVCECTLLACDDANTGKPRFHKVYDTSPSSDDVVAFVRRCIMAPKQPQEIAVPERMLFCAAFRPHKFALTLLLNEFEYPPPFKWQIADASDQQQYTPPDIFTYLVGLANEMKGIGNGHFDGRRREDAVRSYTIALGDLDRAVALRPQRDDAPTRRLRAVLLANRAAAQLLMCDGGKTKDIRVGWKDADAVAALQDGRAAEEADPTYVKGYFRQVAAYERLGKLGERCAVLERALGHVHGADVLAVKNALDSYAG